MTHRDKTLPLFVKGVAARICTSLLHKSISIVSIHGQRYNIIQIIDLCPDQLYCWHFQFLDGSATCAEDSQVGRLSW